MIRRTAPRQREILNTITAHVLSISAHEVDSGKKKYSKNMITVTMPVIA
jgi:hypothetical protein